MRRGASWLVEFGRRPTPALNAGRAGVLTHPTPSTTMIPSRDRTGKKAPGPMFIQTEPTPNPATLKFIPGKTVLGDGTLDFRDKSEATASPLAQRLFGVDGVTGVFLGSDFISVTKSEADEWQHIKPAILGAIMEHYMSGAPVIANGDVSGEAIHEHY